MKHWIRLGGTVALLAWAWQQYTRRAEPVMLQDKVVILTGASAGIGKAAAHTFCAYGCKVVVIARRAELLEALKTELAQYGNPVLTIAADVSVEADLQRIVESTLRAFGRIDILVNNAGISSGGEFIDQDPGEARRLMEINYFGLVNLTRLVLPHMKQQHSGHIVNVSSTASFTAAAGMSTYGATKAAVNAFSFALRRELWKDDIFVSIVMPGWTITEMTRDVSHDNMRQLGMVPPFFYFDSAEYVASIIADSVRFRYRDVILGGLGFLLPGISDVLRARLSDLVHRYVFKNRMAELMAELGA